jgi:hypothetical protein
MNFSTLKTVIPTQSHFKNPIENSNVCEIETNTERESESKRERKRERKLTEAESV